PSIKSRMMVSTAPKHCRRLSVSRPQRSNSTCAPSQDRMSLKITRFWRLSSTRKIRLFSNSATMVSLCLLYDSPDDLAVQDTLKQIREGININRFSDDSLKASLA